MLQRKAIFIGLIIIVCALPGCSIFGGDLPSNRRGVGESARDFLTADDFTSIIVEIDYHTGFGPTPEAVENLRTFIEERLHKPAGVTITLSDEIPTEFDINQRIPQYTRDDIVDFEDEYRDIYNDDNTLAVYFLFVDGIFQPSNGTLGFAYFNTSCTIMGAVVNNLSGNGQFQSPREVLQTNVMIHEFAHLLGLVNDGTPMIQDHEDVNRPNHCNVAGCLMRAFIPTTIEEVRTLDALCIQDLKANGGK